VKRWVRTFILSLALPAGSAAGAGPQSAPCERALAALQARESELAAAARADAPPRISGDARWQALRREAARACLGRDGAAAASTPAASAPRTPSASPPIAVPPVAVPPAPAPPAPAQRGAPPPMPGHKPPPFVTSCDPLGCWTNEGARLPHTGRNPLDARVRCSVQGQIVVCL
jgi:hypothetical protein